MTPSIALEVCVDRVTDALAAVAAGADRIEINTGLEFQGLTPAPATCRWLKQHCSVPILAMLRPHDRGFHYREEEKPQILADCELLIEAGVDGIVFGGLSEGFTVDLPLLIQVKRLCGDKELVFHRAFDKIIDRHEALEQLIDYGVCRVLTSGAAKHAIDGADVIAQMHAQAAGRIEILPGGGVQPDNAQDILRETGVHQLHGSFRNANLELVPANITRTREILTRHFGARA